MRLITPTGRHQQIIWDFSWYKYFDACLFIFLDLLKLATVTSIEILSPLQWRYRYWYYIPTMIPANNNPTQNICATFCLRNKKAKSSRRNHPKSEARGKVGRWKNKQNLSKLGFVKFDIKGQWLSALRLKVRWQSVSRQTIKSNPAANQWSL